MKIAVDGMGGDGAPRTVVLGMEMAHRRMPDVSFLLVGDEARLKPLVSKHSKLADKTEILHTTQVVEAETKPTDALRGLKQSSMRLAVQAVKEGRAQAVLSAGNTGAYMALSKLGLGTVAGITRPAIISQIPTRKGESAFLDLGGNLACNSRHLVEFALMGRLFVQHILFKSRPTVGLLNVGSEASKGVKELKDASAALAKLIPNDFHGFVEGDDLFKGTVDVVVTDGFSGNLVLKGCEGAFSFFADGLKAALMSSWRGRLGAWLAKPALGALKEQMDPRKYNGACWLGLSGVAVKSHGGTDAFGFAHAIEVAADMVKYDIPQRISQGVADVLNKSVFEDKAS